MGRTIASREKSTPRAIAALIVLGSLMLGGCVSAKPYVDRTLGDLPESKRIVVSNPHPVQLLFEFQTNGAANSRATSALASQVNSAAQDAKVFSTISGAPAPGGAVISIKINNFPLTDNAAGKGFMTGLTFGLAGSAVTDGYLCTMEYLPPGGGAGAKLSTQTKHAIHTVIGNKAAPPNADRANSMDEAVYKVTRQLVSNGLNQIASDPKFR